LWIWCLKKLFVGWYSANHNYDIRKYKIKNDISNKDINSETNYFEDHPQENIKLITSDGYNGYDEISDPEQWIRWISKETKFKISHKIFGYIIERKNYLINILEGLLLKL